jgi:hypothetical protein
MSYHHSKQKRTRSQLTLPDLFSKVPLHRSPLKAARIALRAQPLNIVPTTMSGVQRHRTDDEDDEDEILLSPRKRPSGTDVVREPKRPRSDVKSDSLSTTPVASTSTTKHDENNSTTPARKARPFVFPSAATPSSSSTSSTVRVNAPTTLPRARSVSTFDFSTPGAPGVPRLDLKRIATPRREGSPPAKLRTVSVPLPAVATELDVSTAISAIPFPIASPQAEVAATPTREDIPHTSAEEGAPNAAVADKDDTGCSSYAPIFALPVVRRPPASLQTPRRTPFSFGDADMGSPLTPLQQTPFPTKARGLGAAATPLTLLPPGPMIGSSSTKASGAAVTRGARSATKLNQVSQAVHIFFPFSVRILTVSPDRCIHQKL